MIFAHPSHFTHSSTQAIHTDICCGWNMMNQWAAVAFLSTFLAMYLLNCSQVISLLPNPATLLTTSLMSSSVKLYFSCYEILFRSSYSSTSFSSGSTKANMALRPFSVKGLPIFSVIRCRNVSKSTHSPARSLLTALRASKMSLNLRSKPRVRAVLRMSDTSQCLRLSQQRLNIQKKSQQCSLVKTGFLVTISLAKTALRSFSANSLRLCIILTDIMLQPQCKAGINRWLKQVLIRG